MVWNHTNRDMVIIVDTNQVAKFEMPSSACCLTCDTFHGTPISEEAESVVVNQLKPRFVENSGGVCLCNGQAYSIRETLPKGSSCDLNSWGIMSLRVAWSYAVDTLLQILALWREVM